MEAKGKALSLTENAQLHALAKKRAEGRPWVASWVLACVCDDCKTARNAWLELPPDKRRPELIKHVEHCTCNLCASAP